MSFVVLRLNEWYSGSKLTETRRKISLDFVLFFCPEAHSRLVSHAVYGRGTSGCARELDARMVAKYERNENILMSKNKFEQIHTQILKLQK